MDTRDARSPDSTDSRIERAKDAALGKHDSHPSIGDQVGEAAGGISGVLAGAAIGSMGGPAGALVGGIAGAIGGWWTGRAVSEAAGSLTHEDDDHYRTHYESSPHRLADGSYEDVRGAYYVGHLASRNPDYADRSWAEVEPELRRGWTAQSHRPGEWDGVRDFASEGYARGRARLGEVRQRAANAANDRKDQVDGGRAPGRAGSDGDDGR